MGDLVIPADLRETCIRWEGDVARAWLVDLPGLVAAVVDEWDLELGPPFQPGGHISWVAPARRRGDATPLALKLQLPHEESDPEAAALAVWGGRGAVRLHDHDPARSALLLERCVPGTPLREEPDAEAAFGVGLEVALELRRAAAEHPEATVAGRPVPGIAAGWADVLEERGRVDGIDPDHWRLALDILRSAATATDPVELLHGDLNPWNVLRSDGRDDRAWLAIDPKPLVGPPAMEVARLVLQLRIPEGRQPEAVVADRISRAAEALEVAPDDVARWALVDAVTLASFVVTKGDLAALATVPDLLSWASWVVPNLA